MAEDDKNSFSFDNDPGKLTDKDDVDFTFSDIPVLGLEKEKKGTFSFDQLPDDGTDPSIASFEAILKESPVSDNDDGEFDELSDELRTNIEIERAKSERKSKKKKKMLVKVAVAGGVFAMIVCIAVVVMIFIAQSKAKAEAEHKKLTPAQKAALKVKRQKVKIQKMVDSANGLYHSVKIDEALVKYAAVLKIDPNNAFALTGSGKCMEASEKIPEAEQFYTKAIEKKNSDARAFAALAKIMIRRNSFPAAVELLEKAMVKFPDDKTILIPLANCYCVLDEDVKALETYKKIPKATLQKDSLTAFGKLLKLESTKAAKKIFIYTAGKFKDFPSYVAASELASNPKDKVQILTDAVSTMRDAGNNEDNTMFLLLKAQMEAGKKNKAVAILKNIKIDKLNREYCKQIFSIVKKGKLADLKVFAINFLNAFPDDIELQTSVHRQFVVSEGADAALEIYGKYWTDNADKAMANFLYAKSFGQSNAAKGYYRKALSIDPDFHQASIELGKIAMDEKNWQESEKIFKYCSSASPDNKDVRYLFALACVKNGKGDAAVAEYGKFLDSRGLTKIQKAVELVQLALLLPKPDLADMYLKQIKQDSRYSEEFKINRAKRYLLFKGSNSNIFAGAKSGRFRQYSILDKLASGKEKEVLMMTTPKKEFPDFWKVFIAKKRKFKNWKRLARKLYVKHKNDTDQTIKIITSLWLGKIKVENAEKMLNRIPFENEALFYMILADEYLRLKKMPKAKIRYRKAKTCGRNIYSGVVDYYSKKM